MPIKHITIGEVQTLTVENWSVVPDNRITVIQTMGGNVVQDYGHIQSGDAFTCLCNVSNSAKDKIFSYWQNQTKVTIVDEAGEQYENMRVIVDKYGRISNFPGFWSINFTLRV